MGSLITLKYFGSKYFLMSLETTYSKAQQIKEILCSLLLLKKITLRKLKFRKMILENIRNNRDILAMILNQTW